MNFRFCRILCVFLCLPHWAVFAGGKPQAPSGNISPASGETPVELAGIARNSETWIEPVSAPPVSGGRAASRAETVVHALASSYPDRIGEPEFIDGDWSIEVYGERFFYAEGRLLPESLRDRVEEFSPMLFYSYEKDLPPWVPPAPEESARIREQEAARRTRPAVQRARSTHFNDALWRARNRDESYERVKQIRFLGHPVTVHYSILTELSLVEEQILKASKTSAAVRQWISNLNTVDGWAWRNVASSASRSFHSYGTAIDLLPKSLGGLQTYWLWTSEHTEWWTVPYTRRFHPPQEVIDAFEAFGFIWGGKWRYYDTMHFEYRPEVLALNGMERMNLRELK